MNSIPFSLSFYEEQKYVWYSLDGIAEITKEDIVFEFQVFNSLGNPIGEIERLSVPIHKLRKQH